MKLKINGVTIEGVTGDKPTEVLLELDPAGETIQGINVVLSGGPLTIDGEGRAAINIRQIDPNPPMPFLSLVGGSHSITCGIAGKSELLADEPTTVMKE